MIIADFYEQSLVNVKWRLFDFMAHHLWTLDTTTCKHKVLGFFSTLKGQQ